MQADDRRIETKLANNQTGAAVVPQVQPNETLPDVEVNPAGQMAPLPTSLPSGRQRLMWLRNVLRNPKARLGVTIVVFFALVALMAPLIAPGDPGEFVDRPHLPPSREHFFGTEGQGKDVFRQTVWGARTSLTIGLTTGLVTTLVGMVIGMTAGYFGGRVDDLLSVLMNLFLVIPGIPLLVIIAAYLRPSFYTIIFALAFTGWAWGARVLRSQTLSLREKDFVSASIVSGEGSFRIIFREVLPNMASILVGGLIGSVTYAIGAETALSFIGLTNVSDVTWGTNLYWAQNNAGMLVGAWWTFVPSGLCVALVAFGLSLINYGMDEITNPRLRAEREVAHVIKDSKLRNVRATPVIRRVH